MHMLNTRELIMNFTLKATTIAVMTIASASAFAAAGDTATTEIHWSGKVPMNITSEAVIITSLNGAPLTEALKGGELYVTQDGTFTSTEIPLELHQRNCSVDGTATGAITDCATGTPIMEDAPEAIGDLALNTDWTLDAATIMVGGRYNEEAADTTEVLMDNTPMVSGTAVSSASGQATFKAINATPSGTAPMPGTLYTVNGVITATATI